MASDRDILPDDVRPSHYSLSLRDLLPGEPWTYQGRVEILLAVKKPTKTITLNTLELKLHSAELHLDAGKQAVPLKATSITYDAKTHRSTLTFAQSLEPSPKSSLIIDFEGIMNDSMVGFSRARYTPTVAASAGTPKDSNHHYMFSTQFESSDARRAFPCFDEPNLKASIDFDIEIPADLVALSNMPEKEIRASPREGYKVVVFERSPVMSTYLYAWAFGDFEYVEDFTRRKYNGKSLPVRVYTTKGLKQEGYVALEAAHKIVDYYSEIFQIDYPLPKVDMLAVHEFSSGAMENWGLITYRTTAVLFNEKSSDQRYRNRVVYVVAHELAHQWFGNLVTMDWWNELWLNEGFATWVGWYAVDHLHPEWNVWAQFVTEGMQTAFQLDGLRTSHAIEVPVRDASDVAQIFDAISYLKGSSMIRMLSSHLGVKTFLQGIADYLKAHTYGNATTNDLWSALSKASGEDVKAFMEPWIKKIGFPVVTIAEEPGQITARQSRFLAAGDVKPEEDETIWWIPLNINSGAAGATPQRLPLTTKENTFRDINTDFYKINADQTGFFRVNLPPARLTALSKSLDKLSVQDKIGLVGDAVALSVSGHAKTPGALAFIEGFGGETNFLVWSEVLSSLSKIRSIFSSDAQVSEGLRRYTLKLVTPAVEKIGWDFAPTDDMLTGQLRALLISTAGLAGHEPTIKAANERFEKFSAGDSEAIHPSLRIPVYRIVVKNGGKDAFHAMQQIFVSTTALDGKEITLSAMGDVQTPELAQSYLEWAFGGHVSMQDVHTTGGALGRNAKTRQALWDFIKQEWPTIKEKLGGLFALLERFVRMSLQHFADDAIEKDIAKFFSDKDKSGFDRGLAVVSDTIKSNAKYRERDLGVTREWLTVHGYIQ